MCTNTLNNGYFRILGNLQHGISVRSQLGAQAFVMKDIFGLDG
jgi:hypothetical protein